jgi:hypothetical protein
MKTYNVYSSEGEFEYVLEINEVDKDKTEYILKYSTAETWDSDARGTVALKIVDTGNDLILSKSIKNLEYNDAEVLRIILNMNMRGGKDNLPPKYKLYDITEGIEI